MSVCVHYFLNPELPKRGNFMRLLKKVDKVVKKSWFLSKSPNVLEVWVNSFNNIWNVKDEVLRSNESVRVKNCKYNIYLDEWRVHVWISYNAHTASARRVEKCHNVFLMLISVVKVVFLNEPPFSPCQPLKWQNIDFPHLSGHLQRSNLGHSEK